MLKTKMVNAKEIETLRKEGVAVKRILDMGMIFSVPLADIGVKKEEVNMTQEQYESAWIRVTDKMIAKAGADLDNLTAAAVMDFRKLAGDRLKPQSMTKMIIENIGLPNTMGKDELEELEGLARDFEREDFVYVAPQMIENGAVILADMDALEGFAQEKGQDLYIIPSSKHEVLIIPEKEKPADMSHGELVDMIREVNEKEVPEQDILSYSLYHYTRGLRRLEIVLRAAGD